MARREWCLTRDEEEKLQKLLTDLLYDSLNRGCNLEPSCPNYANAFGIYQCLRLIGLMDREEASLFFGKAEYEARKKHEATKEKS